MTDNEIIKALECFILYKQICSENCPLCSELDAAIKAITPCCLICKHYKRNPFGDYGCLQKYEPSVTSRCANWKWIGVKEMVGDNNAE